MPKPKLDPAFLKIPLAHRGLHDLSDGRIENSASACIAAVHAGFGIEIDVQLSADGVAMVFHDDALERVTDANGRVRERTAKELQHIRLRGSSETIPALGQVLSVVKGQVPLLIEIKDQDGAMGANTGSLEQAVAEDLLGYNGPVAVMSFNPHAVESFQQFAPAIPVGLTTAAFEKEHWEWVPANRRQELSTLCDAERLDVSFISHDQSALASEPVARLKDKGLPVLTWTIRNNKEEAVARNIADNVTFEGYIPCH